MRFNLNFKICLSVLFVGTSACSNVQDLPFTVNDATLNVNTGQNSSLTSSASLVLERYCVDCHTGQHSAWKTFTDADWIKSGRVVPGDPDHSPLLARVKYSAGTAANMPVDPTLFKQFSKAEYDIIYKWVKQMTPLDLAAPQILTKSPSGIVSYGASTATLALTTDESASCRYSRTQNTPFDSMTLEFTASGDGKTHQAAFSGLSGGQSYSFYIRCRDTVGNSNLSDTLLSFSVGSDTVAPVLSSLQPAGLLPIGTTQATLSVATNESAVCKYSNSSGTAFSSMTALNASGGGLTHSGILSGLLNGQSYGYYVRCQDGLGNLSSPALVSFSILSDTTAPVLSSLSPGGILAFGTTQTALSVASNEAATCRYSTTSGTAFSSMTSNFTAAGNGLSHSANVSGLVNGGSYAYYVRCQDGSGNSSLEGTIRFSIAGDAMAPIVSNPLPSGTLAIGTTQANLTVTTNKAATCRYSTTSGTAFSSMTSNFTAAGNGLSHSATVTGLANSRSYAYYVKCQDGSGNTTSSDTTISFAISGDTVAPQLSAFSPSGNLSMGTTQATLSLSTNEASTCRYSTTSGASFSSMTSNFTAATSGLSHSATVTGLANGRSYIYYVRCQDTSSNVSSEGTISFSVLGDTTAPSLSSLLPQGALAQGTRSAQLSVTTNESATCRYSTSAGVAYSAMTANLTASANVHTASVTGLTDGSSYSYYVRCLDSSNNANTTDTVISFTVSGTVTAKQTLQTYCFGCHSSWTNYTDADYQKFGLVVPKDLTNSLIIRRVKYGTSVQNMPAPVGGTMFTAFTMADYNSLSSWVTNMSTTPTDVTAPVLSVPIPAGALPENTTQTTVSVVTNEAATCRYSNVSGVSYASMTTAMTADTAKKFHSVVASNLQNGMNYFFHVRCQDSAGNTNSSDYTIAFSVASSVDKTAPAVTNPQPSGVLAADASQTTINVTTSEPASCRYSSNAGVIYALMSDSLTATNGGLTHSALVSGLTAGSTYSFYVRCIDLVGNYNSADAAIVNFSVKALSGNLLESSQESVRLGDRFYVKSFLDAIYGPAGTATTKSLILNALTKFGGPCDLASESGLTCTGLDSADQSAPVLPGTSTPREGQRMKACNVLSFNDTALQYAIRTITGKTDLAYLTTTPLPSDSDIQLAYEMFYPGRGTIASSTLSKLKTLAQTAQDAKTLDPWRYVILALCYAPDWQMP